MFGQPNYQDLTRNFINQQFPQPSFMQTGTPNMTTGSTGGGFFDFIGSSTGQNLFSALPSILNSGFSAFNQYQAYRSQKDFGRFQQQQYNLASKIQDLKIRNQALAIRENAMSNAARARALFAGRGIARTDSAGRIIQQSIVEGENAISNLNDFGMEQSGYEHLAGITGIQSRLQGVNRLLNIGSNIEKSLLAHLKPNMFTAS